jgi:hypothetical protein
MTKTEIETFAADAVKFAGFDAKTAKGAYGTAIQEIKDSGFRITRRVKDTVWAKLETMEAGQ